MALRKYMHILAALSSAWGVNCCRCGARMPGDTRVINNNEIGQPRCASLAQVLPSPNSQLRLSQMSRTWPTRCLQLFPSTRFTPRSEHMSESHPLRVQAVSQAKHRVELFACQAGEADFAELNGVTDEAGT